MVNRIIKGLHELVKIFLIQEDFMLLIGKTLIVFVVPLLTFGNSKVIIVGPRRFYIKEIRAFTGLHFFGENLFSSICLVLFHRLSGFGLGFG
jgi:hypothetical protein